MPRSASRAATWATSISDGFASAMYRVKYFNAARSYLPVTVLRVKVDE